MAAAAAASSSGATGAQSPLRLLSALDSAAPPILAFRAEYRSPAGGAPEPATLLVLSEPASPGLLLRLAKLKGLSHPALCALKATHPLTAISALPGFAQVASAEQRAAVGSKAGLALRSDDRSQERTGLDLIRGHVRLKATDLLQCMRSLLAGLQAMHRAGHVHGLVCPATLLFSPASTMRLSALGAFDCLSARDQQALLSSSPYFPATFTSIDLHKPTALCAADLFAAVRSMLDVASCVRSAKGGQEQGAQIQAADAVYGSKVKAFFVSAFAPGQSVEHLLALVDKALGQADGAAAATSSPHRPTALNGTQRPPVPMTVAASAASSSSSSSPTAAASPSSLASFSLVPSSSYPRLVAAAAASRASSGLLPLDPRQWRVLRAVFQSTRELAPGQPYEISVHVNVTLSDKDAWDQINDAVQETFAIRGARPSDPEIPVVLCTSSMAEVDPDSLIHALRASSVSAPSTVLFVFDLRGERRIVRNVVEDINFQPHHTMVTEDPGEYERYLHQDSKNALPIAWSLGEFVDNAISAQRHNHKKHIPRVVDLSFHEYDRGEWFFIVEDHGSGLSRETLKAFATFGLSRKARNMERDNTDPDAPVFLSGEIGEFGVGSKQAAFFNGRCISVITAQDTDKPCSSSVLELEIAADRMDEAYEQSQNPYAGQVNQRARGNVAQSHLSAALLQRDSIRDLIVKRETTLRQFTRIIVSQIKPDIAKKYKKRNELVNELCRLYIFYLYGIGGFPTEFGELQEEELRAELRARKAAQPDPLKISVRFFKNDAPGWACDDLSELVCDPSVTLAQSSLFLLSKRGEPFCFRAKVLDPMDSTKYTWISGSIDYYPYAEGAESHPQYGELEDVQISNPTQRAKAAGAGSSQPHSAMDIDDEQPGAARAAAASAKKQAASAASSASSSAAAASASSSAPGMLAGKIAAPIFELAWNGRLIPESTCHTLDWIQAACKGRLAPCRFRLKGTLHLVDSPFLRPSKNKLTIASNDLTNHINKSTFYLADEAAAGARAKANRSDANALPPAFAKWLRDHHDKYDREVEIDESSGVRRADGVYFSEFAFFDADQRRTLKAGATIALHNSSKKKNAPDQYGKLLWYVVKDLASSAGAQVHYERLPAEQFGPAVHKAALSAVDLHQSSDQDAIKKSAKAAGQAALRQVPDSFQIGFKGKEGRKIVEGTAYPAGCSFAQQNVLLFGHGGDKALRGSSTNPLTAMRGVFRKYPADAARKAKKPAGGDGIEHLQSPGCVVEFYRPVSSGYKQCPVGEHTSFDGFTINEAGDYLVEWTLRERNSVSKRIEFSVHAGAPVKLEFLPASPVVQCALGSWSSNALRVQFRDAHDNLCPGAWDMLTQFACHVDKLGKVGSALKYLEFFVKAASGKQTGPATPTARGGTVAAAAAASSAAAAPSSSSSSSSLDPLILDLHVSIPDGHELSVPVECALELRLVPRVNVKQSSAGTIKAPFSVNILAGEPTGWQWLQPEVDDADADSATVEVESGVALGPLQASLIDRGRNRVVLGSGQSFQCALRVSNPLRCLCGDFAANGATVSVDSEGMARFSNIVLSVQPLYFKQAMLPYVDVDLVLELLGAEREAVSEPIHVRVHATTAPREIRVLTPEAPVTAARPTRAAAAAAAASLSASSSSSAAAAAASSSSAAVSASPPVPVTLSAAVDSEFPLSFALFDEANRSVSLALLQREYKQQLAVERQSRGALPPTGAGADDDSEMINTFLGLDEGDMTDTASVSTAITASTTVAAAAAASPAAAAGKRKRSATAKAAETLSSFKRRMQAAGSLHGQVSESELVVKGLAGVSRFPLSALTADGVLHGVRMPAKVSAPIEASLRMSWPQANATFTCDFVVQPIYDAPVEMRCAVLSEPAADEPFGAALKLQFEDKHGNIVPPPHQAELLLQLQRVDAAPSVSEEGEIASAGASAASAASSSRQTFTVVLDSAASAASNPLSALALQHSRAGTWEVSLSVPSLPHLSALAHLKIHGGTVDALRFTTTSPDDATTTLLLRTATRSYLPSFRILACDALGNVCALDADVLLKSALFPQRKLSMRHGECVVEPHSQLVKYSSAGASLPIDIVCSPLVEGAGSAGAKKRKAANSKADLKGRVMVNTTPTSKFVTDITKREDRGGTANSAGAAAAPSLLLRVGCVWPPVRVDVHFQSATDTLEEIDLAKFSLTAHATSNKSKATSGPAAAPASASSPGYSYPTPTIDASASGGCTLLFAGASGDVVRSADDHQFVVRFEESSAAMAAVLGQGEIKRQCSFVVQAQAGAPASVRCTYALVPSSINSPDPRLVATGVAFRVLDEFANVIPLHQLPPQWTALKWAEIKTKITRTQGADGRMPVLLPVTVSMHADRVELAGVSVSVGQAPLGSYALSFSFPHLQAAGLADVDPLVFHVMDNSDLSRARSQLSAKLSEQQAALVHMVKAKNAARAQKEHSLKTVETLRARLQHCNDQLPPDTSLQQAQHALEQEEIRLNAGSVAASVPQQHQLDPALSHALSDDPDYIGSVALSAAPLPSVAACRLISWHLASKLRGHLIRRTGPAHALLRKRGLPVFTRELVLAKPAPPAAPQEPGNPRYVSEMLLVGVTDPDVQTCIRHMTPNLYLMDDRESAHNYSRTLVSRKVPTPNILCIKEMEFIGGGWDDSSRQCPSLASLRATKGSFGVRLPNDRLLGLQRRVKLLRDIDHYSRSRAEADAAEAAASSKEQRASHKLSALHAVMQQLESTKIVTPQMEDIIAAGTEAGEEDTNAAPAAAAAAGAGTSASGSAPSRPAAASSSAAASVPPTPTRSSRKRGLQALSGPSDSPGAADADARMSDEASATAAAAAAAESAAPEQPTNRQRTQPPQRPAITPNAAAAAAAATVAASSEPARVTTRRAGFQDQVQDMQTNKH